MKKLLLLALLAYSCDAEHERKRVCEYEGYKILEKKDFTTSRFDAVYYTIMKGEDILEIGSFQIDWNYNVGDTIKKCK